MTFRNMCVDKVACFPKHGWAHNADEPCTAMLWLPILRPLADQGWYRIVLEKNSQGQLREKEVVDRHLLQFTNGAKAAHDTLKRLASTLYRLAELDRTIGQFNSDTMDSDDAQLAQDSATMEMPGLADYVLVLHRRLADQLCLALAPNLFSHPRSAPTLIKKLIKKYPTKAEPRFSEDDFVILAQLAETWLSRLTGSDDGGLRDLLTHRPSAISVSFSFTSNGGKVFVVLDPKAAQPPNAPIINLLKELRAINRFLCCYLTKLCEISGITGEYRGDRDWLPIVGKTQDITEFWPSID